MEFEKLKAYMQKITTSYLASFFRFQQTLTHKVGVRREMMNRVIFSLVPHSWQCWLRRNPTTNRIILPFLDVKFLWGIPINIKNNNNNSTIIFALNSYDTFKPIYKITTSIFFQWKFHNFFNKLNILLELKSK